MMHTILDLFKSNNSLQERKKAVILVGSIFHTITQVLIVDFFVYNYYQ